jgi:peptidoglycan-associated lipoprotein
MKRIALLMCLLILLVAGCGVNKQFVEEQISSSESRTSAQVATLKDKTDANAAEVAKLRTLAGELSTKTDLALNQAKGFENYQIIWSGVINFDFDSWNVTATGEQILGEAGVKMEQYPHSLIEIEGHTDGTGSSKYNMMLGEQRANAAKGFLAERFGISLYRMFIISFGKTKPASMSDEREAASKNRRVTLKVWGNP